MKQFLKQNFKKVKILVAFLIIAFSFNATAQELFTLTGKVTDGTEPLSGTSVLIKGTTQGVTTDFNGNFTFMLKKGTYILVVNAISQPKEVTVFLTKNTSISINIADSFVNLDEVLVSAVRVKSTSPVTHSNITKKELEKRNLGQDIPILLNYLPSVVTTSDAGAGVGYTGIRVRGSDASRVNVTINGIPYNDAESQGTYWVDLPDFSSSTESMQLQRGVGTSTNGSGAFGASLNLLTDAISEEAYGEISSSIGSYNTYKNTVKFSTGKINDHIEFAGRLSKIDSDGYIDRAWSDLKSYFLHAAYVDDNTLIKALTFGGHEKTYQAWAGITAEQLNEDRKQNPYTYENEIDNYKQNHFQLHWNEKLNNNWSTNIGLNYTKGKGYFEQFKSGEDFSDYDLNPVVIGGETITETDLIRRRWLDNNFYVVNATANYNNENIDVIFGGSYSDYTNDHYGEIIWAQFASNSQIGDHYYDSRTVKKDKNIFVKVSYNLNDSWILYADLQERFVNYKTNGLTSDRVPLNVSKKYSFFNPKTGLTFKANENNSLYFSYAKAHREPNRNDFENGVDKEEKLSDFELGWRFKNNNVKVSTNIYYMLYKDQLVLTGAIDANDGAPIRATSGESYRFGLEIDAQIKLSDKFSLQPNVAISTNKNVDFFAPIDGELMNLGKTNLSFSPNIVAGNALVFKPMDNIQFSLLSKYVGEQHMGNLESIVSSNDILKSYFINDFNASLEITPSKIFKSIVFSVLVNNILNVEYISNGYYYTYDDTWSVAGATTTVDGAGYYPQATRNFLIGATFKF